MKYYAIENKCISGEKLPLGGWRGGEEIPPGGWRGGEEIPPGGWRGGEEIHTKINEILYN